MSTDGSIRPERDNYSFRVERELVLTYDAAAGYVSKIVGAGEYIWFKRAADGRTYFIDMDGELGSAPIGQWATLRDNGSLHLTPQWVSWEEALASRDLCTTPKATDDNGDALERLKTEAQ